MAFSAKLQTLLDQGKNQDKADDLKKTLDEIEKDSSTQAYQELKSEISELHQKLNQKLDISEVQSREVDKLNALLTKNDLKLGDLDSETQTELTNLKNVSDLAQITTKSEKINKTINEKGVAKKFNSVFEQIKGVGKDNNKKKELKTKLENLISKSDHFVQEYMKSHKSEIETALSQLATQTPEKKQNNNNNQENGLSTGQKVGIGVGIGGGVLLVGGLMIFVVRRKRNSV